MKNSNGIITVCYLYLLLIYFILVISHFAGQGECDLILFNITLKLAWPLQAPHLSGTVVPNTMGVRVAILSYCHWRPLEWLNIYRREKSHAFSLLLFLFSFYIPWSIGYNVKHLSPTLMFFLTGPNFTSFELYC